jgi:hypothetical protein
VTRSVQTSSNFTAGEVSPVLQARTDFQRRRTGVQRANGFLPIAEGGLMRCPGTVHWGFTRGDAPVRLISFEFNANDAVVLEFYPLIMRVRRYGALVMAGGVPYEMVHPYDADAIARLNWVQSADVIYLADGVLPLHRLARYALDNWTISIPAMDKGPFREINTDKVKKITASAATGTVALTSDFDIFTAAHVGSLLRLEVESWPDVSLWTPTGDAAGATTVVDETRVRNAQKVYLAKTTKGGQNAPVHDEGIEQTATNPVVKWEYLSDNYGVLRITAVSGPRAATATVLRRLPEPLIDTLPAYKPAATYRWAEGAWSDVHGYPAVLTLFDQRLFAARTISEPRAIWASTIGGYLDFTTGTQADEALSLVVAGEGSMNPIQWLAAGARALHIGAQAEEYSLHTLTRGSAVAINNVAISRDSSVGSSDQEPVTPEGTPLFLSRDGRKLYELTYNVENDAIIPRDLTLPARHLGLQRFAQIVWQGDPVSLLWVRRASGDLAVLRYSRGEDLLGWSTVSLAGGVCENMVVTRAASDQAALLIFAVRRMIDGTERRSIEALAVPPGWDFMPPGDVPATHLFCATVQEPEEPADTFSVPHLAGMEVTVWADSLDHGIRTIASDGTLTLDHPVDRMEAGLFDPTHMADLFDLATTGGDLANGDVRRVESAPALHVFATQQGEVQTVSREFGQADVVSLPVPMVALSVAADGLAPQSGLLRPPIAGGFSRNAGLRIKPVSGAALTVLAVSVIVEKGAA